MFNPTVSKNKTKTTIVAHGLKRAFIIHWQTEFMIGKYQQTGFTISPAINLMTSLLTWTDYYVNFLQMHL